jgi:hypothetical protein
MSKAQVPLERFSLCIAQIRDNLRAIIQAADDSNVDCEQFVPLAKERAAEADELIEMMRQALLGNITECGDV